MSHVTDFKPPEGLLDNTQTTVDTGRYIAHIAIPCVNLDEAARWYTRVLGLQPVRILDDRVTFSFGGVLQLVCHLERRVQDKIPRVCPRHFGLSFLHKADFDRMTANIEKQGVPFKVSPSLRFADTPHERSTFMLVDPSANGFAVV